MRIGIPGRITSFPLGFTPGQLQRHGPGPPFVFAYRDAKERETNGLTCDHSITASNVMRAAAAVQF